MAAGLTVGVTAARFQACKRGLAANLAASLARRDDHAVCVVDADPVSCDIGTRLAVRNPSLGWFAASRLAGSRRAVPVRSVHRLAYPRLHVLPCEPGVYDGRFAQACDLALKVVRESFGTVVVDLPLGTGRPGPTLDARLADRLDWLLLAATPEPEAIAATAHQIGLLETARERAQVAAGLRIGVVLTGDEGSTEIDPEEARRGLGEVVVGAVPQLWGRSLPNLGFGPTLGVPEIDAGVAAVVDRLQPEQAPRPVSV